MNEKLSSPPREIWLDGLRGVAALIVAWFHFTTGSLATPYRSFWDSPSSDNRHFIQIAPFRIIFAGQAMVDIFFVVSGYSISTSLIKLRNEGSTADFYRKLTSSVVRRMFRLCFPVAAMMAISHFLFYTGLYALEFSDDQGCPGATPWRNPIPHVACLIRSVVSVINLQSNQEMTLNNHLWTIPVEIRGSMNVYLALLGLAGVSETARLLLVGLLAGRFLWNGNPEFLAFFVGLLFAELDAATAHRQHSLELPLSPTAWASPKLNFSRGTVKRLAVFARYYVFALGVYLLCLPAPVWKEGAATPTFSPDWFFLRVLPPLPWWDWEIKMRTWHTLGAILAISSIRAMPLLKKPFETRLAQFLGTISFSLYLCHQTVYRIMLNRSLNWTSLAVSGLNYWEARNQGKDGIVFVAWTVSTVVIGSVLMVWSRYMAKSVDQRSVGFGFRVEKLLSRL